MATEKLDLTLKVWRQANAKSAGKIETYVTHSVIAVNKLSSLQWP